jgi:predicted double-glycine peptidase
MNTKERAAQASVILSNEVFNDMFDTLEDSLVQQWKSSITPETREFCWLRINALHSIKEQLTAFIHSDKIENYEK